MEVKSRTTEFPLVICSHLSPLLIFVDIPLLFFLFSPFKAHIPEHMLALHAFEFYLK